MGDIAGIDEKNLLALADYLMTIPNDRKFDMSVFVINNRGELSVPSEITSNSTIKSPIKCGPAAFIFQNEDNQIMSDYICKPFGVGDPSTSEICSHLAKMEWANFANTPHGFADRIYTFIYDIIPRYFQ